MLPTWRVKAGSEPVTSVATLTEALLAGRGIGPAGAEGFFAPEYAREIHDPSLMYDMDVAVARIERAIKRREQIVIYGDYDADGITSTALLVSVLREMGAQVAPYLPHRLDDGYGVSQAVLKHMVSEIDLLISVDCGISNVKEVAWLNRAGKDVIIVDHHEIPSRLPAALAILHPRHPKGHYPFPHLCGAGVAFKLVQALLRSANRSEDEKHFIELAALGTIADVMPLTGENRAIVRFGLQRLTRTTHPGLAALCAAARLAPGLIRAHDAAMRIIPRLNAAGRVAHPQAALDVLLARDEASAAQGVSELNTLNQLRQTMARKIVREATDMVDPAFPIAFASHREWHAGIVGLAAARLAETFERPAIVLGGNGRHAVGSARSWLGANILSLLQAGAEHTLALGGHAQAAGFSVAHDSVEDFRAAVMSAATRKRSRPAASFIEADAIISPELCSWEALEKIEHFEPCGAANPAPRFVMRNVPIMEQRLVGKTGGHVKISFQSNAGWLSGIGFGLAEAARGVKHRADILFELEANEWRGRRELQLSLKEIVPGGKARIETRN